MPWTHKTMVVPSKNVELARFACELLAGSGGSGMFSTGLSKDGSTPPTHYISSGLIEELFSNMLDNPELLRNIAGEYNLDADSIIEVISSADITNDTAEEVFSRLGLKLISE